MVDLPKYIKNGFVITNETELSAFVLYCVMIVEKYLSYVIARNRVHIPLDLNAYDAAVELTADIFIIENNRLTKFANHFKKLSSPPESTQDIQNALTGFLICIAKNRMLNLYRTADPDTYRIMRSLNDGIHELNIKTTYFNLEKYVYRRKVNFENQLFWEKEELVIFISRRIFSFKHLTYKDFIIKVLDLIESQNKYIKAVSFNNLVLLHKLFCINSFIKHDSSEDYENSSHYNILFAGVKENFKKKLEHYFHKKNVCEHAKEKLLIIVDDFMSNLLKDSIRKTPSDLTLKYFHEKDYKKYHRKVEYVLQILINELQRTIAGIKK